MAPLIIFAVLFLCGLVNSYFFPPSKLLSSLRSLLISIFPAKKKPVTSAKSIEIKKEKEELVSAELETIFSTFDRDGDGFITAEELEESLTRLRLSATKDEISSMMERVDANGDGLIDVAEFRELYESLCGGVGVGVGREELLWGGGDLDLREAFEVFDGNRDGVITVEELGEVLRSMGLKQGAQVEDLRDMIRRVDLDGDGKVNFQEFKKMMMVKGGKLF